MAIDDGRISFGGELLPCYVERFPQIKKAQRKFRQYNIPGRSGDIFIQEDAYENVIQPYEVYAGGWYGSQPNWTEMARVLYKDGYQILKDSYDPDHFRKAVFNGPLDVENSWNTHGRATIEFNCRPERYREDGAAAIEYEDATYQLEKWAMSDLSSFLQTLGWPDGTEYAWLMTIPYSSAAAGDVSFANYINYYGDGGIYYVIITQTPDAATYATSVTSKYIYSGGINWSGSAQATVLFPAQYFDGIPIMIQDGMFIDGAALNNPYMPAHPTIVLHKIGAAYTGEEYAFALNGKCIYIKYDSGSPYYFIDTENLIITKSDALDGNQILANNARIDAGFFLASGVNYVKSSAYYTATLTPNFWEL